MTELTCPHCQQLCPPDGRWCAECGTKLVIDPPPRVALEAMQDDLMQAVRDAGEDAQAREGKAI